MIITKLTLQNFRSHKSFSMDLKTGVTGICGVNGAGKSTIIEAILWAFYGNLASRTTADQIKTSTANESETTSVEISFELKNDFYTILREIKGKSQTPAATILKNGQSVVTSPKEVTNYMTKLLGNMNFQAFTMSVVARQSELAALSNVNPANREKIIRQMLGIDEIDVAIDVIRADKRDLNKKIEILEPTITNEDGILILDVKKEELKQFKTTLTSCENELGNATSSIKTNEILKFTLKSNLSELEEQKMEIYKLELNISSIITEVNNQSSQLHTVNEKLNKIKSLKETIPQLQKDEETYQINMELLKELQIHKNTHDQIIELNAPISAQKTLIKTYKNDIVKSKHNLVKVPIPSKTELELTQLKIDKTSIEDSITLQKSNMISNDKMESELSNTLSNLERLGPQTPCPTCTRTLGENYEILINSLRTKTQSIKIENSTINKIIVDLIVQKGIVDSEISKIEKETQESTQIQANNKFTEEKIIEIENKIKECELNLSNLFEQEKSLKDNIPPNIDFTEISQIENIINSLRPSHDQLLIVNTQISDATLFESEKINISLSISKLSIQLRQLSEQVSKIVQKGFSNERLTSTKHDFDLIVQSLQEVTQQKIKLETQITNINVNVSSTEKEIERLATVCENIEKMRTELQLLELMAGDRDTGYMLLFRRTLISRIRPQLSTISSNLISQMTDGKYTTIELDENYNILMQDEGILYDITRFSGGERDIANLCVRIAISKLISERHGSEGLSFIILDEIFGSLDSSRKNLVLNAINTMSNNFDQILLITHSNEIKDELPNQITLG